MRPKTAQRLFDYTRANSAGISVTEVNIHSILKNLYLETKDNQILPRLVYNGDLPFRKANAYDDFLDKIGSGFGIIRGPNETDESYRQKIKLSIIKSPTVEGLQKSISTVFSGLGFDVSVTAKPAVYNFFDGVNSTFETPVRGKAGSRLFRIDILVEPSVKVFYPNFLYGFNTVEITENLPFPENEIGGDGDFKRNTLIPGTYSLHLNPFDEEIENLGLVEVYIKNTQFTTRRDFLIYSAFNPPSRTVVDLGFLSEFQQVYFKIFDLGGNQISLPSNYMGYFTVNDSKFDFYRNPEYNTLILNFGVNFLREIFNEVASFGIIIERIAVKNAGTGGY